MDLEYILANVSIAFTVALLVRIYTSGLIPIYRAFAVLMAADAAFSIALRVILEHPEWVVRLPSGQLTRLYPLAFFAAEMVKAFLYIFASVELFTVILKPYRGIVRAGRIAIYASLAAAVLITLGVNELTPNPRAGAVLDKVLGQFLLADRTAVFALAVFLVVMLMALLWFPVKMSRNARLHSVLYVTFFTGKALVFYAIVFLGKPAIRTFSKVNLAVYTLCLIIWTIGLSRSGELSQAAFRGPWQRADAGELTKKLEIINARLAKTSAKLADDDDRDRYG
ncbi:MAG: hypothetical protein ABI823_04615 [Bryobacteraceae bacterium]